MEQEQRETRGPVVVVSGPTAAGKTALALVLGERFGGEIVNADSQQVYRFLDIGTAKPTPEERARVPHHVLDVVDPDVAYDAARFARDAAAACAAVHGRGRPVFLCGGTGLYIRALLHGLDAGAGRDPELRRQLEEEHARALAAGDPGRLHRRLAKVDPRRAAELHPNDVQRIVRALEIHARTGRPPSELAGERRPSPYRVLHLAVDPGPEALRPRIDARCEAMVARGLLWEVRELRERGYGPELPSMQAIGYRHMEPVLQGTATLASVLPVMKRDTRTLARRQRTWLRALPEVEWVHPEEVEAVARRVERFLAAEGSATGRAAGEPAGAASRSGDLRSAGGGG